MSSTLGNISYYADHTLKMGFIWALKVTHLFKQK
jgi:hypothetical protein